MNKKLLFFNFLLALISICTTTPFTIQSNGANPVDLKTLLNQHNKQAQSHRQQPKTPAPQPTKTAQTIQVIPKPDHPILNGLIQAPQNVSNLPEIKILFDGQQTSINSEGFYSFPLEKNSNLTECSILICNQIYSSFSGINTVENLSINSNKKHRFFTLKKIVLKENKYKWEWVEQNLQQNNFVIPKNCIVFLIHPKYFEQIEEWKIQLMDNFIGMPKIVLKNNIPTQKLAKTSAKSHLYTLDNQYFHETIKQENKNFKKQPNVQVFLAR